MTLTPRPPIALCVRVARPREGIGLRSYDLELIYQYDVMSRMNRTHHDEDKEVPVPLVQQECSIGEECLDDTDDHYCMSA